MLARSAMQGPPPALSVFSALMGLVMTELDRRAIVTGLAAVAAAGVTPALSASATPIALRLVRTGHSYAWRSDDPRELITATFKTAMTSRWHVDMRGSDDVTYLHVPSGFHFAVYPHRPNRIWRVCFADELKLPTYEPHNKLLGRAVVFAHDNSIALARGQRGRDGSFIVDFASPNYAALLAEDAPPLPPVEAFTDAITEGAPPLPRVSA